MHYYKRNIGDYYKKSGRLSMLQHGSYTLLIDSCYDRERFPTMSEAIEWVWASSEEEIKAVKFVLSRFFVLTDGVYIQKRIQEEIENFRKNSEINRRIALEREAKNRGKQTKRSLNSTNRAKPCTLEHEPPPNQEPLTTNQELGTKNKNIKSKSKTPLTPQGGNGVSVMVILPDWMPAEKWQEFLDHRKLLKKPMTENAQRLGISKLDKFRLEGQNPIDIIDQSIISGWAGFFAIKKENQNGQYQNNSRKLSLVERVAAANGVDIYGNPVRREVKIN